MLATEWSYYPMDKPDWRPKNPTRNRRTRNAMTTTVNEVLERATERWRNEDTEDELPIYNAMVEKYGDPKRPILIEPEQMSKRAAARLKARTGRFTAMVWASLNPDGTVDPMRAVSAALVNTKELPLVEQKIAAG